MLFVYDVCNKSITVVALRYQPIREHLPRYLPANMQMNGPHLIGMAMCTTCNLLAAESGGSARCELALSLL